MAAAAPELPCSVWWLRQRDDRLPGGRAGPLRLCLTRSLVHARLSDDACLAGTLDRAEYGGHLYLDKAPGISVLSIPGARSLEPAAAAALGRRRRGEAWFVRLTTGGLGLLLFAFLVGRLAEGLSPGWGGANAVRGLNAFRMVTRRHANVSQHGLRLAGDVLGLG